MSDLIPDELDWYAPDDVVVAREAVGGTLVGYGVRRHAPKEVPPKPVFEPEALPRPRHTSASAERDCLGCAWMTLRRKIMDREAQRGA